MICPFTKTACDQECALTVWIDSTTYKCAFAQLALANSNQTDSIKTKQSEVV